MTSPNDDPRLTAYALGELPADEHAEVEALLARDARAKAEMAELREVGARLGRGLRAVGGPALSDERRAHLFAALAPNGAAKATSAAPELATSPALEPACSGSPRSWTLGTACPWWCMRARRGSCSMRRAAIAVRRSSPRWSAWRRGAAPTAARAFSSPTSSPGATSDALRFQAPATSGLDSKRTAHAGELLHLELRYQPPEGGASRLSELTVKSQERALAGDFRFAAAVAQFGMLLRESPFRGSSSYDGVLELARPALGSGKEREAREEFVTLVRKARDLAQSENRTRAVDPLQDSLP